MNQEISFISTILLLVGGKLLLIGTPLVLLALYLTPSESRQSKKDKVYAILIGLAMPVLGVLFVGLGVLLV